MTEENTSGLSAAETAYFESRGEAEIPAEPEAQAAPEAAATPEKPEKAPESQPERDKDGKFAKTIPFDVFHAEREEHKRTKAALEEVARKQAVLDDRWNTLLKAQQQQEPAKIDDDPEPDPNNDIFAHNAWLKRRNERIEARLNERDQAEQQTKQQQEQEQVVWGLWNQSVEQFTAEKPDFKDASAFLMNLRVGQLTAVGLNKAQIDATINREVGDVVKQAYAAQKSPAEIVYQYAIASGYTQKAPEQTDPPAQVDGSLPDKLKQIQHAQDASRTVGGSGGSGVDPDSAEAILAMSEADFAKWLGKNPGGFKKLAGG